VRKGREREKAEGEWKLGACVVGFRGHRCPWISRTQPESRDSQKLYNGIWSKPSRRTTLLTG